MTVTVIIALLISGLLLFLAELLLPGGVMGILGGICLVAGLAGVFIRQGFAVGVLATILTMVFAIVAFSLWFKHFPKTGAGKRFLAQSEPEQWRSYDLRYAELVGREGVCLTMLRPSGKVQIDDERYDVVTEGEILEAGTAVRVIEVEGNRIVVERV
ncbi:MAG: hypothetical protein GX946_00680 [Oligosphaeraceae bacterium]|nr:hypothetical protein [Oligosphaeraceae bacterium]